MVDIYYSDKNESHESYWISGNDTAIGVMLVEE